MRLESARALKAQLFEQMIDPFAARTNVVRTARAGALGTPAANVLLGAATFGIRTRDLDAVPRVQRSIALGIAPHGRGFRVAVRIQRPALRNSAMVERIHGETRGEVDVRVVGHITMRGGRTRAAGPWYRGRLRPLVIGGSVGHARVTAGTLGAFVRHRGRVHVLSNNHVLANADRGRAGDAIVQPGVFDGGVDPADTVATLTRWVRLKPAGSNLVDAALARLHDGIDYDPVLLKGIVRQGDRQLAGPGPEFLDEGTTVYKIGRTTGASRGRVTAFDLDNVVVGFDVGNRRFDGQIEVEGTGRAPFSDGGDSGALIVDARMHAVALLFAGSDVGGRNGLGLTYANPIDVVLTALDATLLP